MMRSAGSSTRNVAELGQAYLLDYVVQFALPVALVRLLDGGDFAQYRIFWLIVNTAMAISVMHMPQSLFFFLPRSDPREQQRYVLNVIVFLLVTGIVSALAVNPWLAFLPEKLVGSLSPEWILSAFIFAWTLSSLLDHLPSASGRVGLQARLTVVLSVIRAVAVVSAALITREIEPVLLTILGFAIFKMCVLFIYCLREYSWLRRRWSKEIFGRHLRYAFPFGLTGTLYMLKVQSDNWIAAALYPPTMYAAFSLGVYVMPLSNLIMQAVGNATLANISECHAKNEVMGMLRAFREANVFGAFMIFPVMLFLSVFAEEIVVLVFTRDYLLGATVIRIYAIATLVHVLNVNSLLRVYNAGRFTAGLAGMLLPLSVLLSLAFGFRYDVVGCAVGGASTLVVGELLYLRKAASLCDVPISKLLNWSALAVLFGSALSSVLVAKLVLSSPGPDSIELLVWIAGSGLIFASTYLLLIWTFIRLGVVNLRLGRPVVGD